MVVTVVDVSIVRTLKASFESCEGLWTCYISSFVLLASRFIEDLCLSFDIEVAAKSHEPFQKSFVSSEGTEYNFFEGFFEAKK